MQGMPPGDLESGLFRALAVAYMYVVTSLAWMMYRRPTEPIWPALLAHAKLASAAVSFLLLVLHGPYLAYLANGVVDGAIGAAVLLLRRNAVNRRRAQPGRWGQPMSLRLFLLERHVPAVDSPADVRPSSSA